MIWHIWWLVVISLVAIIVSIIVRVSGDETEYVVPAHEIEKIEAGYAANGHKHLGRNSHE